MAIIQVGGSMHIIVVDLVECRIVIAYMRVWQYGFDSAEWRHNRFIVPYTNIVNCIGFKIYIGVRRHNLKGFSSTGSAGNTYCEHEH